MERKKFKINGSFLNNNRAYLFLIIVLFAGIFRNNFFTGFNINSVTGNGSLVMWLGLGFTICLIAGHMDLTVQYVSTLAALLCLGLHSRQGLPWLVCILIATGMGVLVGLINGFLVTKLKIHSFIATLGMQFVLRGVMYMYSPEEQSIGRDYTANEALNGALIPGVPFSLYFLITTLVIVIVMVFMRNTRTGRNIYMVGGNLETAWLAGVKSNQVTTIAFVLSSTCCALGGALNGIYSGAANISMGEKGIAPLMIALTATIIGGTDIAGGHGSVFNTYISLVAVAFLRALFKKTEMQVLVIAIILIACICYETIAQYRKSKVLGTRPNLHQEYLKETGKG
ncbi:MAG: ABC transporter permease [Lachnospiraceae bacterium]|jgi:ribose/xylose/arabinose/galactoside ABC-type transport system permease subunit|nr:ABC transporter permease [Lachnospiraceae bacterium]MCI8995337.1 ABC transporter permease [Lachnospiraceae bacterium]MCI9134548.1 ABC transporter permease [Lachnospiraceae bacterium]